MSDWTSGYVVDRDTGYTFGYYGELNPLRTRAAFLGNGLLPGRIETACELGFGQGLSTNLHAAASTTRWWGTDFNPAQAAFAQELAGVSGADAALFDQSFHEFCNRSDLPDFDYIGLHGIWSWISDENRALIVDFIRRKLKVGGVAYLSYNTMPGWAGFAPVRRLMTEHAEVMAAPGRGVSSRVSAAVEFVDKLLATNPRFLAANPQVAERMKAVKGQNVHYLAHEYFNLDWAPMPFADMAKWLGPAKLDYACSAHYLDHIDIINLAEPQRAFLAEIPDRMFRETTRDFMVNQQFRRDYWVKGVRTATPLAQMDVLRNERFLLVTPAADVPLKVSGNLGEAGLQESVYAPIIQAFADHRVKSFGEVEQALASKKIGFRQLLEAVGVLVGGGHLQPAQANEIVVQAKPNSDRLNKHLLHRARSSNEVAFLASPVSGGGIPAAGIHQLFLLARSEGKKQPSEWASFCWEVLQLQGQRLLKQGKAIESAEENLAELTRQAKEFSEKRLPILQALQIA